MNEPKSDLYNILSETGYTVYQRRPEVIASFPCLTFYVADNVIRPTLEKEIGYQQIVAVIDIWAKTSAESGEILLSVESAMRENNYIMSYCSDINDPDGYSHISTRFNLVG